ncbi:unnamed protein product [Urochloa humidicola]
MAVSTAAAFCFAVIIVLGAPAAFDGGNAGGELKAPGGGVAADAGGSELKATTAAAGGSSAAGEPQLTPPRSAGGSSAGGELMTPAGSARGSAVELMPPGSASAFLRQQLSLADLGSNCSTDCLWCLSENIGSCLVHAIMCPDPLVVVQCFVGKFLIIEDCFGGAGGKEGQLTTTGSAASDDLVQGGSAGAARATTATRTAQLSALLRIELAIPGVGIKCSDECIECLTDSIGSCIIDAVVCFNPLELAVCFAVKSKIIVECFRT